MTLIPDRPRITTWDGQPVTIAHLKLDGHFLCVLKDDLGVVKFLTRQGTNICDKMRWNPLSAILYTNWPNNTCLFGELYIPDVPASQVKTAINEQSPDLKYSVFHVPSFRQDLTTDAVCDFVQSRGLDFTKWYDLVTPEGDPIQEGKTVKEYIDGLMVLHKHDEGFVLKDGLFGRWYKLKHNRTIDAIVSGYVLGEGKYTGLIGSLTCSLFHGRVIANVSGMTDDERVEISAMDPSKLMGKIVEVKYDRVDSQGKLRHPRFVRFRTDKRHHDCLAAQDTDLVNHYLKT